MSALCAVWYALLFVLPDRATLALIERSPAWLVRQMARRYPP